MTTEKPYECDTSRYYKPYQVRGKCVCNQNLVEIDGFCLCNESKGFELHQQNDNCECTKQGSFQYLSTDKKSCVPCDEQNGQILVGGQCVCSQKFRQINASPLTCVQCAPNQYLVNNTCYCKETNTEGICKQKTSINISQISVIVVIICLFVLLTVVIEMKISKECRRRKIEKKQKQEIQMIRRSALIVIDRIV
ncbi:Hypothetical_protein [Hexamita inflata]|uniref:Hypothetical_protein n=1 Tax=Hexamita inflata TaxID=28002 RepID=A0AA86R125_9EUKA|nr:Hypothetical protein HINF_LOCUS57321 [Hexamita inflata]